MVCFIVIGAIKVISRSSFVAAADHHDLYFSGILVEEQEVKRKEERDILWPLCVSRGFSTT